MKIENFGRLMLLLLTLSISTAACGLVDGGGPPRNAVQVEVVANTSLLAWLGQAAQDFNDSDMENSVGDPIYVSVRGIESGQAVATADESLNNSVMWIPDEMVWVNMLANQGNNSYHGDCESVAQSPLVIGMWRSVAESLGWPGLPLGWLDVGSLAADTSAWQYFSGGEFGDSLRLGHTHPGLSGTGSSTLLALVQAAQSKSEAVTAEDISQPIVQASVGAFEGGVTWFSTSTDLLGQTMQERGVSYLGAAIMYESTVVLHGNGEIVPIYPLEGTFMATYPACINQSVDNTTEEAAKLFRDYLVGEAGQTMAVSYGIRPVNANVSVGAPLDSSRGVDLNQPAIIFNAPTVQTVYAVQDLWQTARKDVNLVMLLDTSGSMRGSKMDTMQAAAIQFVEQMGDDDYISVIAFSTEPELILNHVQVGPDRDKIITAISRLQATGDTTLFDAIGDGADVIAESRSVDATNVLVVLSDGQDTRSYRYRFNDDLIAKATANETTIFTIAYGNDADETTLGTLAQRANGNYYEGDEASITAIYEEMSAAFGGSVGVGR